MQRRGVRIVAWGSAGLLLAGCGIGADAADRTTASPAPATVATTPPPAGPAGTPDPDALADFRCEPDSAGQWSASGTVTNGSEAPADYLVTVVVAGVEDVSARGQRRFVPDLPSGATYEVRLRALPAPAAGELSCQAQVLRR